MNMLNPNLPKPTIDSCLPGGILIHNARQEKQREQRQEIDHERGEALTQEARVILAMINRPHTKGIVLDWQFFKRIIERISESMYLQEFFDVDYDKGIYVKGHRETWFLKLGKGIDVRRSLSGLHSESMLFVIPKDLNDEGRAVIKSYMSGSEVCEVIEHD